ncbi:unnamed protein product [Eruca vesicaria subsp. sativa]|uniref:Uncharacterized protein n=1 Tax=Eruca vesicaria subsp. sativa TaxID=29727 RepID=A0ABC8KTT0_ERUVS|nr:unnamed protein product [Eruca vesicaria subsp. sativa]
MIRWACHFWIQEELEENGSGKGRVAFQDKSSRRIRNKEHADLERLHMGCQVKEQRRRWRRRGGGGSGLIGEFVGGGDEGLGGGGGRKT